ncbi:MAG: NosD domain-containing protein [Thermoleophilia bacterium]
MTLKRFAGFILMLIAVAALLGAAAPGALPDSAYGAPSVGPGYTTTTLQGIIIQDDATGGQCTLVGSWDPASKTCTLTTDINVGPQDGTGITVVSNNVTVNGDNHTLTGTDTLNGSGVVLNGISGATVAMLNIRYFGHCGIEEETGSNHDNIIGNNISWGNGILLGGNNNNDKIMLNTIGSAISDAISIQSGSNHEYVILNNLTGDMSGVSINNSAYNVISGNKITVPDSGLQPKGVYLYQSQNNIVVRNGFIAQFSSGGSLAQDIQGSNNHFYVPPATPGTAPHEYGGNYWSTWTTPDRNGDGFVDNPFVFAGNQDNYPYAAPFGWDKTAPAISSVRPTWTTPGSATITAELKDKALDTSGINNASISVYLSGPSGSGNLTCTTAGVNIDTQISCPASGLVAGSYTLTINVADNGGNPAAQATSTVHVGAPHRYFFPWYDSKSMSSWLLMANPSGAGGELGFDLSVGGGDMDLSGTALKAPACPSGQCEAGEVPSGMSITPIFSGLMGGPVTVSAFNGKGIISERSLMGSSFEEVLGTDESRLSGDFYWTWYDNKSPGFTNWILVANPPSASGDIYYEVKIGGQVMGQSQANPGVIAPGKDVTPTFPGIIGGPVEVTSCSSAFDQYGACGGSSPGVLASQRVLSNFGAAFNEVPGVPTGELSSDYLWTWYDQKSPGFADWVMVANPSASDSVYYQIKVGGQVMPGDGPGAKPNNPGVVPPLGFVTPQFPGLMGGPVEVTSCSSAFDQYGNCPGTSPNVVASKRSIAGPSFEEVPGYPVSALTSDYHFSWYDMHSPGSANWVMITNPSASGDVYYQVKIAGQVMTTSPMSPGAIGPLGRVTPLFPGVIGGPVEITAWSGDPDPAKGTPANVMVSQRVLWNGFFNEVLGTVIK